MLPGVAPPAPGSAGSIRGDFAVNVNGAREDSNNFLLDGVFNGDPQLNGIGVTPPVDAVREFEIVTSAYDASFGRNAGGQVNVVLKSGTNQFHGAAYEFFRNRALDARNFFAPPTEKSPQYQRNQFGASLGGPVIRNRTFFFGDYEGRRLREGVTRITNVPTDLERAGDFSRSNLLAIDPFTQLPFAGNVIPEERRNPVGLAIAALYPLPNRSAPNQNYVSSPASRDREDHFDVRLDHNLGAVRRSGCPLQLRRSQLVRALLRPHVRRHSRFRNECSAARAERHGERDPHLHAQPLERIPAGLQSSFDRLLPGELRPQSQPRGGPAASLQQPARLSASA